MAYDLALGDRAYSSWSMRGWLLFERFGIAYNPHYARLSSDAFATLIEGFYPVRTVPAVRFPEGAIGDSLAIAEELATAIPRQVSGRKRRGREPSRALWPPKCIRVLSPCAAPAR